MPRMQWRTLCSAFAVLLSLGLAGCESSSDGKEWVASPNAQQQVTQVVGALDTGQQKVCSGVNPGQFRDSIVVPSNWMKSDCQSWATSIGTSTFQLGCLNSGGVVNSLWGPLGGSWSVCGW